MNLQLDHFPMIKPKPKPTRTLASPRVAHNNPTTKQPAARLAQHNLCTTFEHGSHNVSRWMTWLPISLKNAAKCDKWYQLQNHSITESLNANGAREKPPTAIPVHAVSLSVEQKPNLSKESWLVWSLPRQRGRGIGRPSGYPEFNASHRRFMGNSHSLYSRVRFTRGAMRDQQAKLLFHLLQQTSFVTDLSAAGSPAELKHITQRRKRKQP